MRKSFLIAAVFLTMGAGNSLAQNTSYVIDKDTNFLKYRSYKWVPIKDAQLPDMITGDQIIGTVDAQLSRKGLTRAKSEQADLFIGYQMASINLKRAGDLHVGGGYGTTGGPSGTVGASTAIVHSGQLVLDMYDPESKRLIWRGIVSDVIDENDKPEKKQKRMDKAIEKLLKEFPPQKKS